MTPGAWLRARRTRLGLTQAQAADRACVSQGTWSQLERDVDRSRVVPLGRVALAVDAPPHLLRSMIAGEISPAAVQP